MASGLSEQQRLKIEENRQRAIALRAARQQQQQQQLPVAADGGRKSNPAFNNCQSVTCTASAASFAVSRTSVSQPSTSTRIAHTRAVSSTKNAVKYAGAASSGRKPYQPTTLADSSNRTASAVSSYSKSELNAAVPVKCCLISRQKFAADCRYFPPLLEVFKSMPSKQYGDN